MKKILFILTLILPLSGTAKFGWSFTDYSFLTGQQYRIGQRPLWSFEFQFDRYNSSCLTQKTYFGVGVNYSYNDAYSDLGLKLMLNPTLLFMKISKSISFYPYIFGQGSYISTKIPSSIDTEAVQNKGYNFRPGIGLTGNFRENKLLSIKTYVQMGFNIPLDNAVKFNNPLAFEVKIGVGINANQIKKNKRTGRTINQLEAN